MSDKSLIEWIKWLLEPGKSGKIDESIGEAFFCVMIAFFALVLLGLLWTISPWVVVGLAAFSVVVLVVARVSREIE